MPSPKNKPVLLWLIPAIAVFIAGFLLASHFDLAINIQLYTPRNLFAIIMEGFGWFPLFIPLLFLFSIGTCPPSLLNMPKSKQYTFTRVLSFVLLPVSCGIMFFKSSKYLISRRWLVPGLNLPVVLLIISAFILLSGILFYVYKSKPATRIKLLFWSGFGTVYLAFVQGIVTVLKTVWQRTRFDTMLANGFVNFEPFTAWYEVFSGAGGKSFPSGHTASACGVFVLLVLCDLFPAWQKHRKKVLAGCWLYIALMAFSRILIGRHYLSDTLAAAGIGAIIFMVLRRLPLYKTLLQKTTTRAENRPTGEFDDI